MKPSSGNFIYVLHMKFHQNLLGFVTYVKVQLDS